MSYNYDIFVSYPRDEAWDPWVQVHLKKFLRNFLKLELRREPRIYIDCDMAPATDWPSRLGEALGSARVLITILSGLYFTKQYCLHELDLMLERLSKYPGSRLIVPIIVNNCENLPKPFDRITLLRDKQDFSSVYYTELPSGTVEYFNFQKLVKHLAPDIAAAVRSAPAFDADWVERCTKRINAVIEAGKEGKTELIHSSLCEADYEIGLPEVSMQ